MSILFLNKWGKPKAKTVPQWANLCGTSHPSIYIDSRRAVYMETKYHLICLKRSRFADSEVSEYTTDWWMQCDIVYWRSDRAGYTRSEAEAGRYTLSEIADCCGDGLDWLIMRVPTFGNSLVRLRGE